MQFPPPNLVYLLRPPLQINLFLIPCQPSCLFCTQSTYHNINGKYDIFLENTQNSFTASHRMFLNNIINTVRTKQRNNTACIYQKRCFYEVALQRFIYFCKPIRCDICFFESVHWILLIVLFFFFEFLCSLPKCHKNILKSGLFMVCLQVLPIRNHFRNIKQLFTQTLKLL